MDRLLHSLATRLLVFPFKYNFLDTPLNVGSSPTDGCIGRSHDIMDGETADQLATCTVMVMIRPYILWLWLWESREWSTCRRQSRIEMHMEPKAYCHISLLSDCRNAIEGYVCWHRRKI